MRTFVIGRSPDADIVLADASVARQHAELVITADGRFHLTDCGSYRVTVQELLARRAPSLREQGAAGPADGGGGAGMSESGLRGPVERDPRTGEIVRRRI
jgi:hypothetical protein